MSRNKADFRAAREAVGASRAFIADELGVAERSVKRWEDPRYADPPEDAWELINALKNAQRAIVSRSVAAAKSTPGCTSVNINYYRSQEQFDTWGRDRGNYNIANANARAVAVALESLGFEVAFSYPGDESYTLTPRNPRCK